MEDAENESSVVVYPSSWQENFDARVQTMLGRVRQSEYFAAG